MGYFSNGTEGMAYEEEYCLRCVHGQGPSGSDCAIWNAHHAFNYDQFEKKELADVLNMLIPRVPHTFNDGITSNINAECSMFLRVPE